MAALPLTVETLTSSSQEVLSQANPYLKADSSSKANSKETPERPSKLTIDQQKLQQHQHQQHSNVTPTSIPTASTSHVGNISPALSSLSPSSFLPEMPQWKRDLIQRRKQNVQRTISASSPTSTASSALSPSPSSSPIAALFSGVLKTSTSSSSVRSLAGSNTQIDQLASDALPPVCSTKDNTKTSLSPFAVKVNKQIANSCSSGGNTVKPATTNIKSSTATATIIMSPLKEKAEKLFGGQYTATTSLSSTTTPTTTTTTKEEIITTNTKKECKENVQQEFNQQHEGELEEESAAVTEDHIEIYRKTKEEELELNEETQTSATVTTTTTASITNKQQMATRLTGSTYNTNTTNTYSSSTSSSSSSSSIQKRAETEREKLLYTTTTTSTTNTVNTQQNHNSIIGANVNFVNQSLNKCESERLVCTANITGSSSANNIFNNTNNSATIGGISVSSNNINQNNNNLNQNICCSSGGSSNSVNVVKISQKLQENQFIKNEQQLNTTKKIIKFKQNTSDLKSPTKAAATSLATLANSNSTTSLTSSSSSSSSTLATTSNNCAIKKKMVAVQEMKKSTQNSATHLHPITSTCQATTNRNNNRGGGVTDLDNSEDLSYGPGIVSKLRCRYLSLALRESMEQQRLNKDNLRRSTSLNNLLDNTEDEENCEDDDEEAEDLGVENEENQDFNYKHLRENSPTKGSHILECKKAGILKTSVNNGQEKRFSANSQGSNGVGVTFTETSNYSNRSRHLKRGNDSLKRARSVEALLSEKSPWYTRGQSSATNNSVSIEDKIHNARERLQQGTDHLPPKRLTSIIDDTERPPPDLVKQTLKMFEATANRRPKTTRRSNSKGDVASKVETFKNIIKEQKPLVTYPKPLSPTKKLNANVNLPKSLKAAAAPQANDLLQSPLGRKTLATASTVVNSNSSNECLTSLKTNNHILSDHTPDIIPRQKLSNERDFKQNKEKFESPLSAHAKRGEPPYIKEKFEVDSPLTALTKELSKLKLNDSNTPTKKTDNICSGSANTVGNGSVGGVGGGGDSNVSGDACQSHDNKYPYNNDFINDDEETLQQESTNICGSSSSLKNENDKIININNKTKPNSNNEATATTNAIPTSPSSSSSICSMIATKANEATVNNYDGLTKASSPPPSSSDLSDGGENYDDGDTYGGLKTSKRITRTALDNIAKAGYTQQFKFNNTTTSSPSSSSSTSSTTGVKQIGVIRPLLNTQQQKPSTETAMETLKHQNTSTTTSPLTSREIEKNRINDLKKSSTPTSSPSGAATSSSTSSPSASLEHHVIKSSHTSSPASASATGGGFSDVDSVISATNSPLWAMRKRRQAPPAAPAENTSMVFNFSNRKEVPDYIENDGVIFRRKRELPKPNESGFVLLGDLSVETSTDMDYDDFSMCPPSPCDVEFVNANIVIDGKSSIRQKSKDTTFRVQFNDTLTSTFEYPSEASLIVDDSFSAYNESYTQPLGSSLSGNDDEFNQAFQNLCLENHQIADEIIQLPTLNSSPAVAANASTNSSTTPTKNILGNLPLGSAPLGFYTPLKAPIDRLFQLGVTRAPSYLNNDTTTPSPTEATASAANDRLYNGVCVGNSDVGGDGNGSIVGISGGLIQDDDNGIDNAADHAKRKSKNFDIDDGEPESLQYIKPADDDLNIAYSEGTQKTDLLY